MPLATITIAGINPPEAGKKQGKLTDTAGGRWNIWGDKLTGLQLGASYDIDYSNEEFNGRGFTLIKSIGPSSNAALHHPAQQAPPVQPRQSNTVPAAAYTPAALTAKDEQIFVCGGLNNALANPNVDPSAFDTTRFVNKLRHTWMETFARGPYKPVRTAEQSEQEIGDKIPF